MNVETEVTNYRERLRQEAQASCELAAQLERANQNLIAAIKAVEQVSRALFGGVK